MCIFAAMNVLCNMIYDLLMFVHLIYIGFCPRFPTIMALFGFGSIIAVPPKTALRLTHRNTLFRYQRVGRLLLYLLRKSVSSIYRLFRVLRVKLYNYMYNFTIS